MVDVSVGFSWVHPGQATPETDALLQTVATGIQVVVPALWFLEMANVTLAAQRRHRLTSAERLSALERLGALQLIVDEEAARMAFGRISDLAVNYGLTIYDATYLEVALRRKMASLASRDEALRSAGKSCGLRAAGITSISIMPIATINAMLTVTPQDEIQILHGKDDYEFVDDRTPFTMRVMEIMHEDGLVIGVFGARLYQMAPIGMRA